MYIFLYMQVVGTCEYNNTIIMPRSSGQESGQENGQDLKKRTVTRNIDQGQELQSELQTMTEIKDYKQELLQQRIDDNCGQELQIGTMVRYSGPSQGQK